MGSFSFRTRQNSIYSEFFLLPHVGKWRALFLGQNPRNPYAYPEAFALFYGFPDGESDPSVRSLL